MKLLGDTNCFEHISIASDKATATDNDYEYNLDHTSQPKIEIHRNRFCRDHIMQRTNQLVYCKKAHIQGSVSMIVEINESRIPVAKGKGIPEDEKREREKTKFKTEANSASPNANSHENSPSSSWEIEKETMLQKGDSAGYNAE